MKPCKCTDREWSCHHKSYSCLTPCPEYWMPEARNFQNPQKLMDYVSKVSEVLDDESS